MVSILRAIISGIEHSYENHTPGGMASTFALLEMAHTHYFGKEPEKVDRRHKTRHHAPRPEPGGYPRINMLPPRPRKVINANSLSGPGGGTQRLPDKVEAPNMPSSTAPMPPAAQAAPIPPMAVKIQTRSMSADGIGEEVSVRE